MIEIPSNSLSYRLKYFRRSFIRLRCFGFLLAICFSSLTYTHAYGNTHASKSGTIIGAESLKEGFNENFEPVKKLDSRSFDNSIKDGEPWLIEFYAPWCSHCRMFEKTYQEVSDTLKKWHNNKNITVAKVDGSSERALASRFKVRHYPTFFLIQGWNVWSYHGPRTRIDMVKFVTETHLKADPIPFLSSPFGPLGLSKTWLMKIGMCVIYIHEFLVQKGLSEIFAAGFMVFVGFISFVVSIITVGIVASNKMKED